MRLLPRLCFALLLAAALLPATPAGAAEVAAVRYTVTDLGVLPGGDLSFATAVNNAGHVVGYATTTGFQQRAFIWRGGALVDLGTLPGGDNSAANAVNDTDQVAGVSSRSSGGFGYAVSWTRGAITDLGSPNTQQLSFATGIDPAGRVVGAQRHPLGSSYLHPFRWDQTGRPRDLGLLPGNLQTVAYGTNSRGQVVGGPAFVWQDGTMTALPALTGTGGAIAKAVNGTGVIVGWSSAPGGTHAVRWQRGAITDLGTLPGRPFAQASAVSVRGEVVGWADPQSVDGSVDSRAFRWYGGTPVDLNTLVPAGSGWRLQQATGINTRGQIVGAGQHNGHFRAFLLTPLRP